MSDGGDATLSADTLSVDAQDLEQAEELAQAIIHGDVTRLKEMLAVDGDELLKRFVGAEDQTALHLACDVNVKGDEMVKMLTAHGSDVHAQDAALRTPLLVACEVKAFDAACHLMSSTAASLVVADENGQTPLHWLAMHGSADLLALALKKGAEVDPLNSSRQTPLNLAIANSHLACALVLLDAGASPSVLDEQKRTAMHLAMQHSGGAGACSESTLLLLRLLQLDPTLATAVDADKRTPLHWACGKNAQPCVRALIKSGAPVDATDWAGRTPLLWAVLVDAVEAASELLESNADALICDRDQRTALHWAADRASEGCMKLLLKTALTENLDTADWGGYSALHYAARRGGIQCVKMLLASGADRRVVGMRGETPADLTTCEVTKALLMEKIGMKRQRSLSSANSLVLFSVLPDLTRQFYEAWTRGDLSNHVTPELRELPVLTELMRRHGSYTIDDLHVSTKSSKVVVELTSASAAASPAKRANGANGKNGNGDARKATAKAMHSLGFTDDGLVCSFVPYCLQPEMLS